MRASNQPATTDPAGTNRSTDIVISALRSTSIWSCSAPKTLERLRVSEKGRFRSVMTFDCYAKVLLVGDHRRPKHLLQHAKLALVGQRRRRWTLVGIHKFTLCYVAKSALMRPSLFGVLRSSAIELSSAPRFNVFRGPRFSPGSARWPSHHRIRRTRRSNLCDVLAVRHG